MKGSLIKPITLSVALIGGVLVGAVGTHGFHFAQAATSYNTGPSPVYPTNSNGQTYGSDEHATSMATEPDLILAQGTNGKTGYVLKSDLFGHLPQNPQQAVAMDAQAEQSHTIPLYASNGTTVIGTFKVGPAQVTMIHSPTALPSQSSTTP